MGAGRDNGGSLSGTGGFAASGLGLALSCSGMGGGMWHVRVCGGSGCIV
jgi:hypothetical protein